MTQSCALGLLFIQPIFPDLIRVRLVVPRNKILRTAVAVFYMLGAIPVAQPPALKCWRTVRWQHCYCCYFRC